MRVDDEIGDAAVAAAARTRDEDCDRVVCKLAARISTTMLDKDQIAAASRTLHDHWRAGTKLGGLEASLRPRDRVEAYAIQAAIENYSSGGLFGWKIAAT